MGLTLVTLFSEESRNVLDAFLQKAEEPVCKIPYGRVEEAEREKLDTLPPHFTVSAWKSSERTQVEETLGRMKFPGAKVTVNGILEKMGAQGSRVLYLSIAPCEELKQAQEELYRRLPNPKYHPDSFTFHLTVGIDRDAEKIRRVRERLAEDFRSFALDVCALGLFEIYPAVPILKLTERGMERRRAE